MGRVPRGSGNSSLLRHARGELPADINTDSLSTKQPEAAATAAWAPSPGRPRRRDYHPTPVTAKTAMIRRDRFCQPPAVQAQLLRLSRKGAPPAGSKTDDESTRSS